MFLVVYQRFSVLHFFQDQILSNKGIIKKILKNLYICVGIQFFFFFTFYLFIYLFIWIAVEFLDQETKCFKIGDRKRPKAICLKKQVLFIGSLSFEHSNWQANLIFTQYNLETFCNPKESFFDEIHTSGDQFDIQKIIVWGIFSSTLRSIHCEFYFHVILLYAILLLCNSWKNKVFSIIYYEQLNYLLSFPS